MNVSYLPGPPHRRSARRRPERISTPASEAPPPPPWHLRPPLRSRSCSDSSFPARSEEIGDGINGGERSAVGFARRGIRPSIGGDRGLKMRINGTKGIDWDEMIDTERDGSVCCLDRARGSWVRWSVCIISFALARERPPLYLLLLFCLPFFFLIFLLFCFSSLFIMSDFFPSKNDEKEDLALAIYKIIHINAWYNIFQTIWINSDYFRKILYINHLSFHLYITHCKLFDSIRQYFNLDSSIAFDNISIFPYILCSL